jgi:hypothetical protein
MGFVALRKLRKETIFFKEERKMFSFESRNGKMYDVLSYDNERDLTLLHEINDRMENTYLVVENMKNNGLIWAKEHSFTNYKEAHDYFVT